MEYELHELVAAIEKLSETGWYNSPLITGAIGSLVGVIIGAIVTIKSNEIKEYTNSERDKIYQVNRWIFVFEKTFNDLLLLKKVYLSRLGKDSGIEERATDIPLIMHHCKKISEDLSELFFLLDTDNNSGYEFLMNINFLVSEYNMLLDMWSERNKYYSEVFKETHKAFTTDYLCSQMPSEFKKLAIATNAAVKKTDDVLLSMQDLLESLPKLAKPLFNVKLLKRYGPIVPIKKLDEEEKILLQKLPLIPQEEVDAFNEKLEIIIEEKNNEIE